MLQLVPRPQLLSVVPRDEDHAVLGTVPIHALEMLVQVFSPELSLFVGIIEDPHALFCENAHKFVNHAPVLAGKRESDVVVELRLVPHAHPFFLTNGV